MIDVLITNTLGPGFTRKTTIEEGIGGSELEVTQVAHALAKRGHEVVVAVNIPEPIEEDDVQYIPVRAAQGLRTKTSIAWRTSPLPPAFADRLYVRATDVSSPPYDVHLAATVFGGATLICNTEWHAKGFAFAKNKVLIPPMLDPTAPAEKVPGRFVYASAISKGLNETIEFWKYLKDKHKSFHTATLLIVVPGMSGGSIDLDEEDMQKYRIEWSDTKPVAEYRALIATGHLFYVNSFPETFGCVAAIAERAKSRTHIYCFHGKAGIPEALVNSRLVVTDPKHFEGSVMEAWKDPSNPDWYAAEVPDRTPEALVARWEEVLGL
jgi:hypothetical protein